MSSLHALLIHFKCRNFCFLLKYLSYNTIFENWKNNGFMKQSLDIFIFSLMCVWFCDLFAIILLLFNSLWWQVFIFYHVSVFIESCRNSNSFVSNVRLSQSPLGIFFTYWFSIGIFLFFLIFYLYPIWSWCLLIFWWFSLL